MLTQEPVCEVCGQPAVGFSNELEETDDNPVARTYKLVKQHLYCAAHFIYHYPKMHWYKARA